ncbi:MAG: AsmA family protein [Acidobacteriia bacterium]|nr:AsmA family protein [Terriglobia bacterium]
MRRIARIIGILAAVFLLVLLSLPFSIDANRFRPLLESRLSAALARDVKVGDLKLSILSGGVSAADLSIADDPAFGRTPFLQAKSLRLAVDLWALVSARRLNVVALTIEEPRIALIQTAAGDWNFSSLGARSAARTAPPAAPAPSPATGKTGLELSVKLVKIANGRFSLGRTSGHWQPLGVEKVNLELRDFSAASVFPFSLSANVEGGGTIKLEGKAGPIDPMDAAMTPVSANLKVAGLDLARSGLHAMAPTVSGLVSFDGAGESDGRTAVVKGHLKAEKLKLAAGGTPARRAVELDFAAEHDLKKHAGVVQRGDIRIGAAPASLTGAYGERAESLVVNLNLHGPNMPLAELAEMLPALGIVLPAGSSLQGGTASVKLALEGPLDRLVTTGSVSLNKTRLAGFDLPGRMAAIAALAGIRGARDTEIELLSTNLRMAPEGMSASEIQLVAPAIGEIDGTGSVSPAYALDFHMRAMVHTGGVMAAIRNAPIPFSVAGTCSEPVFRPDLKVVVKQEIQGLGGNVGKAAGGLLKGLLGGKKKN